MLPSRIDAPSPGARPWIARRELHAAPIAEAGRVAGYQLKGRIARGGMGDVYHATQLHLDRDVAIKLIRDEHALSPRHRRRFVAEAHRAAALFHPNIVPVLDAGDADGVLFIAMPFVLGTDLDDGAPDVRRRGTAHVVRLVHRVACALDAAHQRGIVHRDVKPSNVLIARTSPEHPLLTDFGLAAAPGEISRPREGTLAYLAPERWVHGRVSPAADVYALAAVLHELLTGEHAFARTLRSHLDPRRPSVVARRPELPVELDAVIARGFAVDVAERYATATLLTRAVAAVLGVELSDDEAPAPRRRSRASDATPSTLTGGAGGCR